jgi:uncharacterized protein YlxW (UPF0749 family)
VTGEHAGGPPPQRSRFGRIWASLESHNHAHRPRLGSMSTSLLNSLLTEHLDRGYVEAAERRRTAAAAGTPEDSRAGTTQVLLAVGLLLVGFVLAAAYRNTAHAAPDSERARQGLVRDVEGRTTTTDQLQRRAESLGSQLVKERDSTLTSSETGDTAAKQVRDLEDAAALVPVKGPGIVVVLGDAAPVRQTDPATGEQVTLPPDDSSRLRDRDLQSVVNALWAAGAEAIAINEERLAPTTTIRAAGEAILVDLRPVTSPYTISAIGDPDTLLPRFADSAASRRYQSQTSLFGISFSVERAPQIRLRAATSTDLVYAHPVDPSPPPGQPRSAPAGSGPGGSGPGGSGPAGSGPGGSGSGGSGPGGSGPGGSGPGGATGSSPPPSTPSGTTTPGGGP